MVLLRVGRSIKPNPPPEPEDGQKKINRGKEGRGGEGTYHRVDRGETEPGGGQRIQPQSRGHYSHHRLMAPGAGRNPLPQTIKGKRREALRQPLATHPPTRPPTDSATGRLPSPPTEVSARVERPYSDGTSTSSRPDIRLFNCIVSFSEMRERRRREKKRMRNYTSVGTRWVVPSELLSPQRSSHQHSAGIATTRSPRNRNHHQQSFSPPRIQGLPVGCSHRHQCPAHESTCRESGSIRTIAQKN